MEEDVAEKARLNLLNIVTVNKLSFSVYLPELSLPYIFRPTRMAGNRLPWMRAPEPALFFV